MQQAQQAQWGAVEAPTAQAPPWAASDQGAACRQQQHQEALAGGSDEAELAELLAVLGVG